MLGGQRTSQVLFDLLSRGNSDLVPSPNLAQRVHARVAAAINVRQAIQQQVVIANRLFQFRRKFGVQTFIEIRFEIGFCKFVFQWLPDRKQKITQLQKSILLAGPFASICGLAEMVSFHGNSYTWGSSLFGLRSLPANE